MDDVTSPVTFLVCSCCDDEVCDGKGGDKREMVHAPLYSIINGNFRVNINSFNLYP